jgi:hypothetical protein
VKLDALIHATNLAESSEEVYHSKGAVLPMMMMMMKM